MASMASVIAFFVDVPVARTRWQALSNDPEFRALVMLQGNGKSDGGWNSQD